MILFTAHRESITLSPGQRWAAPAPENTYRDTAASDLWEIVKSIRTGTPWREAVKSRYAQSHPWLYRVVTSPQRDLFFRQHPPHANSRVLDVGAGWGQISLPHAQAGHSVTALEPTPERLAFIEAAAHQEKIASRMYFIQGDAFEIDFAPQFDLVCCIGVLEWVPKFRAGDPRTVQIEFLQKLRSALAPGGQLVIGIENRLGLKYVLGAPDDHIGLSDIAVYDADLATKKYRAKTGGELRSFTFTEAELRDLLAAAGFSTADFHGAFPDYKLPETILPLNELNQQLTKTEIPTEHNGTDGTTLPNQAELASHYRSLAQLGVAHAFAPSFFVRAYARSASGPPASR